MATKRTKPPVVKKNSNSNPVLIEIADRINGRTKTHYIETGRDLISASKILEYGTFCKWLKNSFGWSESTARNFMNAAKLIDKSLKFADLQPSAVMALAAPSVPESAKDKILADLDAGKKLTVAEIKATIKAAKPPKPTKEAEDVPEAVEKGAQAPVSADASIDAYQDLLKLLKALGPKVANDAIKEAFDLAEEDRPNPVAEEPRMAMEPEASAKPLKAPTLLTADNSDDEIQDLVLGEAA